MFVQTIDRTYLVVETESGHFLDKYYFPLHSYEAAISVCVLCACL